MSSGAEWEETTLGAEVDLLTGFPFKSERYTDSADSVPLARGDNIVQGAMRWDGVKKWPLSERGEYELYELREGDVVLAMDRPWIEAGLKYAAISKHDLPCLLVQRTARLRGGQKLNTRFLRYLIGSREFTQHIHAITTGTAVPHISGKQIKDFAFTLPPLPVQKAIAAMLGALDDKTDLNRRMNATLEAMVLALFQSWFVDFDPVRANLDRMRIAGVGETTAALFSDHLEDSPLGKVPVGWRVLKFADILTPHSVRVGEDSVPEFSATVAGLSSRDERFKKQLSKSQSKNKRIVDGDLVFGFSREVINFGLMREPVGAVSPVYEVFKIDSSKIEPELLERLFRFNMPYYMDILKPGAREGKPIDRDYLLRKHLLVPDIAVQRAFLTTIQPWTDKIKANESESRTLATLRDTLLPKLLSGELSVEAVSQT
jgi:type I restriction enzyme S subunit